MKLFLDRKILSEPLRYNEECEIMVELFFKGTPNLETERLILRKLTPQDDKSIFEYASDNEVPKYMTWNPHKTIEDARGFINFTLNRYEKDEAGEWGIVLKESNKLIGAIGFPKCDKRNMSAEIGYVISRLYWGSGIMPEAVNGIFKFAFEEMGLKKIECCHFLPNEKSGRVMQKVGMSFDGIVREKFYIKGQYRDVKQYSILKSDWVDRVLAGQ